MRAFALIVLSGCGLHPEPTTWTPLDTEALLAALDEPTATVADLEAQVGSLGTELSVATTSADVLDDVVEPHLATEPVEDPYVTPDEGGEVQSTNVFVRIACPGEDAEAGPDPGFGFGHVQIDSPLLFDESAVSVIQGDLLLTAVECVLGDATLDASLRGVWDADAQRLLATGDVQVAVPEVPEGALQRISRLDVAEGASRFSVDIGDAGYATASATANEGEFALLLADGEAVCTIEPEPSCTTAGRGP